MRNAIVEKLNKEFLNQIKTEAQAVYVLVEIRKIIKDHDEKQSSYPILSFFCDWVVHSKMEYTSAKRMLDTIQNFYRGLDSYLHIRKTTSFFPFVMLIVLRRELRLFLKRNDLSVEMLDEENQWEKFLFLLIDIIIDCPLIAKDGYIRQFKFIEYASHDDLYCELILQDGTSQSFKSKSKSDFIEEDYLSYARTVDGA